MNTKTVFIGAGVLLVAVLAWRLYSRRTRKSATPASDESTQAQAQASNTGQDLDPLWL
jgi:predicted negative regulator of RcsB-dependent stress response